MPEDLNQATAATTPAPVYQSMRVEGIDYNLYLVALPAVKTKYEAVVKNSFEKTTGYEVSKLEVFPGSVIHRFEVKVPTAPAKTAAQVKKALNTPFEDPDLARNLAGIQGIGQVAPGPIRTKSCGISADKDQSLRSCQLAPKQAVAAAVAPAVAMPAVPLADAPEVQASMPEDLNQATAATTPAPVYQSMRVEGIDYNLYLVALPAVKTKYEAVVKNSFEKTTGYEVSKLEVFPGSVIHRFEVKVPTAPAKTAAQVKKALNTPFEDPDLARSLAGIQGIGQIAPGPIRTKSCGISA